MTTSTQDPRVPTLSEWATSQSGRARIRLFVNARGDHQVYALDGHELLPRTRSFTGPNAEQDARDYANTLWSTL